MFKIKSLVFIPDTSEALVNEGVVCGEYDPNCADCKLQRQVASKGCVSHNTEVWQVFEESIEQAEKGFSSWLLQSQAVRIIKILSRPATLPISVAQVDYIGSLHINDRLRKQLSGFPEPADISCSSPDS